MKNIFKKIPLITSIFIGWFYYFNLMIFAQGDVSGVIEESWKNAEAQIKQVVNNVIFPALSVVLAIFVFVKLGSAYFDY